MTSRLYVGLIVHMRHNAIMQERSHSVSTQLEFLSFFLSFFLSTLMKLINETTPFTIYSTESTLLSIVPLNCNHVIFIISKSYVVNDFSFLNSPILIQQKCE